MSEQLVDISQHGFKPGYFGEPGQRIIIGSQGTDNPTDLLTGIPAEMTYEQRHGVEGLGAEGSLHISLYPQPAAEVSYQEEVLGYPPPQNINPPAGWLPGERLDLVVAGNPRFMDQLKERIVPGATLHGFNQTQAMHRIADYLGIAFMGNSAFADFAGTKVGLQTFAEDTGLKTPPTFLVSDPSQIPDIAGVLRQMGHDTFVLKLDGATGGMGHEVHSTKHAAQHQEPHLLMPKGSKPDPEGKPIAVAQGWVDGARLGSLAIWVDPDGTFVPTGAQMQHAKNNGATGAQGVSGASPMSEKDFEALLPYATILGEGYVAHKATGPHAMDFIFPPDGSEPLAHDENTRPGAWTLAQAYIHHLRGGENQGSGWVVSEVKVPSGTKASSIIETLRESGLLLTQAGPDAHGAFPYGLGVVEYGGSDAFFVIALSKGNDPEEAQTILGQVNKLFGNTK